MTMYLLGGQKDCNTTCEIICGTTLGLMRSLVCTVVFDGFNNSVSCHVKRCKLCICSKPGVFFQPLHVSKKVGVTTMIQLLRLFGNCTRGILG